MNNQKRYSSCVSLLLIVLFRIGVVVTIFVPLREDIKCLVIITIIFVFSILKIIFSVWTIKHWTISLYEFLSDILLGLMFILIYREGISRELNYEAILAIITTFYIVLGLIFHIGRILVPIKMTIERMRSSN